jgi:UDP-N-acetylglucosamine--N-acetylmuramyl-(pentapeptide) pyrophosphoryl-undecaprenol N-acetylglucosamine transferase
MSASSIHTVFFLAGRTGGPLIPLRAIEQNLTGIRPIYIGVKGGFEEKFLKDTNTLLEFLPDARFRLLTFKKQSFQELLQNLWEVFVHGVRFIVACIQSILLLLKYKPSMVISSGSFLAVPMIFATKVCNTLRLVKIKIVIHQQDPLPGLSHTLTISLADIRTCVFRYTKDKFTRFRSCTIIPNPINKSLYTKKNLEKIGKEIAISNPELEQFLTHSSLPLFLVFGGGTGSKAINDWLISNLDMLTKRFRILHLTGALQKDTYSIETQNHNYFSIPALVSEMPYALSQADVVLCRSGMSSYTELMYLQKPAYMCPIPHSHQEINADVFKHSCYILDQNNIDSWADTILDTYPTYFSNLPYPTKEDIDFQLQNYYQMLQAELDKTSQ